MPKKVITDEEVKETPIQTKKVKNIAPNKVELDLNGKLYVFKVNEIKEVPLESIIPKGIGLHEIK